MEMQTNVTSTTMCKLTLKTIQLIRLNNFFNLYFLNKCAAGLTCIIFRIYTNQTFFLELLVSFHDFYLHFALSIRLHFQIYKIRIHHNYNHYKSIYERATGYLRFF